MSRAMRRADKPAATFDRKRLWNLLVAFIVLALTAGTVWIYLSLESPPSVAELLTIAERGRESGFAPLFALTSFVVGGLLVFPVNLLIAATIVVFGPVMGAVYALLGSLASAVVVHELGRRLPATLVARLFGARGERLRKRIVGHGLLAVAIVRFLPVAPYSVVSVFFGVARVRRSHYIIGTALGMLPGITLYAIFIDRAREALLHPNPLAWLGVLAAILLIVVVAVGLRVWQRQRDGADSDASA
ncbi:MAG: VTT domain-containing protein [Dokdonella sp.]